jgi:uncharacterized protein YndB with AHSA1/START domain
MSQTMSSTRRSKRAVSVERVIPAEASAIFDILADPRRHAEIDGSGTVKDAIQGPERLELGSHFSMAMKLGIPYRIVNTVVEFEPNKRIAWRHFHGHIWRYELEELPSEGKQDAGTRTLVRETFDWSKARTGNLLAWLGVPERHIGNMTRTLERLEQVVTRDAH